MDNKILTELNPEEIQLLVSLATPATGNRMRENVLSFEALACKIQLTQLCEKKLTSNTLWQPGSSTQFDQMGTTDGEQLLLCVGNTRVLMHSRWNSFGSSYCENS